MYTNYRQYLNLEFNMFYNDALTKKQKHYKNNFTFCNYSNYYINDYIKNSHLDNSKYNKIHIQNENSFPLINKITNDNQKQYCISSTFLDSEIINNISNKNNYIFESKLQNISQPILSKIDQNCITVQKRIASIEAAGRVRLPTSIQIELGLGESKSDILSTLEYIKDISSKYKHIISVLIVQNNNYTNDTLYWTIAVARIILNDNIHISCALNNSITIDSLKKAGIDDLDIFPNFENKNFIQRDFFYNKIKNRSVVDIDLVKLENINAKSHGTFTKNIGK